MGIQEIRSSNRGSKVLTDLVSEYCDQYLGLRSIEESDSNIDFHRNNGLVIKVPAAWNAMEVIPTILMKFKTGLIFYNNVVDYKAINDNVGQSLNFSNAEYLSWHELYHAIYNRSRDVRNLERINSRIKSVEVVIIASSTNVDEEIISHIQSFCNGCLICLA